MLSKSILTVSIIALVSIAISGWAWHPGNWNVTQEEARGDADQPAAIEQRLLEIAKTYRQYGRVDDETRWAPFLCRMPMPSLARFSESDDDETHGQKLYFLFAKDRDAYLKIAESVEMPDQVIVKESWQPVETELDYRPGEWKDWIRDADDSSEEVESESDDQIQKPASLLGARYPLATREGKVFRAEKLAGLYIMFRTDSEDMDTDEGWIYGTVSPDGKKVTSSGLVQTCISCHQDAPYGRLFGMQSGER